MFYRAVFRNLMIVGLLAAGCRSGNPPVSPNPNQPTTPQPQAANQSGNDPTELARQTSQYAQNVGPMLTQKGSQPGAAPSVVQWTQPQKSEEIAPTPQQTNLPPSATRPAAARSAILAADKSSPDSDLPLILPESADRTPSNATPVAMPTDAFEQKLAQQVRDYPRDLGTQLDYELLRFVRDEQTPDLGAITQLPAEDREILAALLDGISNFRNVARSDSNPMLGAKIQPLLDMADRMRSQAELEIPVIALCTDVKSFGVYDPMPAPKFIAGRANNQVVIYCEVVNFSSTLGDNKMWQTRLRQEMVLYTDTGQAVWPDKSNVQEYIDSSRNRRHDFFLTRKITLPSSLAPTGYLLKVTLTDEQSNRVAEATTPIEIVAE